MPEKSKPGYSYSALGVCLLFLLVLAAPVCAQTLPSLAVGRDLAVGAATVRGKIGGLPFICDEAKINSYSLVLRQKHGRYARIVVNFMPTGRLMSGGDFSYQSGQKNMVGKSPLIEVCCRESNKEKLRRLDVSRYNLQVKFANRRKAGEGDTTSGAIALSLANGDSVYGNFRAKQSPRLIWDDEAVLE